MEQISPPPTPPSPSYFGNGHYSYSTFTIIAIILTAEIAPVLILLVPNLLQFHGKFVRNKIAILIWLDCKWQEILHTGSRLS